MGWKREKKQITTETGPEEENPAIIFENCDGIILTNLREETTDLEVLGLLNSEMSEVETKKIKI